MRCCRRTPRAWAGRSAPPPRSRARGRSPCTRGRSRSRTARSANSTLPMWTAASSIATAGSSPPCTCGARASRSSPSRPISRSISRSRRWSGASSRTPSRSVRLEQLARPVLALDITAADFKALDLKQNVAVTASGRLTLTGPVIGATLTGRATVTSGVLYFADLVRKRIVNLDELVDTALTSLIQQQRLGPQFESVFLDSLRIRDLKLDMGSDVWLRSSEANIQLAGTVFLKKERKEYLVSGTLQASRGTYRLKVGPVTREFVVSQGTVRYFGTPDQDAELNIEAKHTLHPVPTPAQKNPEDVTVVAHITGTLLVPRVTLEAEKQDFSQTEVISYLLFGKPTFR